MNALRILGAGALMSAAVFSGAANASADTTVTPAPVTFVDTCGTDSDTYIIPNTTGVGYYVDGVKLNPGVRQVDATKQYVQVFTVAEPGYKLSSSATWDHQFDATTGCAAKPSPTSSTTSSTSAPSPSSSSSSTTTTPAPSETSSATDTDNAVAPAPSDTPSTPAASPSTEASTLPRTGANFALPFAAVGGLSVIGGGLVLASSRMKKSSNTL